MSWTLIVFVYAGMFAKSEAVAVTHVPGFTTEIACVTAGNRSKTLVSSTKKELRFVCVKTQ